MPEHLHPEPLLAVELAAWSERKAAGLAVAEHSGRSIVRLEWRAGDEPRLPGVSLPAIGGVGEADGFSLMRISPVSAIAVSDSRSPRELADNFSDGHTAAVDVSHGFLVLRLAGAEACALLDDLAPPDLSEKEFRLATLRRTQIGGHGVTIHCTATNALDLYVDRSYAWSLWRYLSHSLDAAVG